MNGLGNAFNYVAVADSVVTNIEDYGHVTVIVYEASASTVISITRLKDGAGSAVIPDTITEYWTSTGGGQVWARNTQTAADEVTTSANADNSVCIIELDVAKHINSDGGDYNQVNVEVDGSATVQLILSELKVKRAPQNLPAVLAS